MDFDEAIEAVSALAGESVDVLVSGPGGDHYVAQLGGTLHRVAEPEDVPPELERAIGETAVTFRIGDSWRSSVAVWPSRFMRASRVQVDPRGGVEIVTREAVIYVRKYLPPWS